MQTPCPKRPSMDIPRPNAAKEKRRKRIIIGEHRHGRPDRRDRRPFPTQARRTHGGPQSRVDRQRQARPDGPPGARVGHARPGGDPLDRGADRRAGGSDRPAAGRNREAGQRHSRSQQSNRGGGGGQRRIAAQVCRSRAGKSQDDPGKGRAGRRGLPGQCKVRIRNQPAAGGGERRPVQGRPGLRPRTAPVEGRRRGRQHAVRHRAEALRVHQGKHRAAARREGGRGRPDPRPGKAPPR